MKDAAAIDDFYECEETIDVQKPGCDLEGLWLHSIKPLLAIEHAEILADGDVAAT